MPIAGAPAILPPKAAREPIGWNSSVELRALNGRMTRMNRLLRALGPKLVPLDLTEQVQLQAWEDEMRAIAGAASDHSLVRRLPKIVVVPLRSGALGWEATTTGARLLISKDCLTAPTTIRRYLLAHELGHTQARHSLKTLCAALLAIACLLGVVIALAKRLNTGIWLFPAPIALALLVIAVAAAIPLYVRSRFMRFEWEADELGAKMIGTAEMVAGNQQIQAKRAPKTAAFYANKLLKLQGGKPSMRQPK